MSVKKIGAFNEPMVDLPAYPPSRPVLLLLSLRYLRVGQYRHRVFYTYSLTAQQPRYEEAPSCDRRCVPQLLDLDCIENLWIVDSSMHVTAYTR